MVYSTGLFVTRRTIDFFIIGLALTAGVSCMPAPEYQHELEVTATAYNSVVGQTSGDPTLAAWGDRLDPGIATIAVSRDLIPLGLGHNVEVKIDGFEGTYLVRDKLNKRFTKRIDIYMGIDVDAAKQFGKQSAVIRWNSEQ